ncbi:MAG: diguanylate cyclase [Anaerolineales bacterium]
MTTLHLTILLFYAGLGATGLGLARAVWRRRRAYGAVSFAAYATAIGAWSLFYMFELSTADLPAKLAWASVQFAAALAIPPAWIIFCYQYARRQRVVPQLARWLLAVVPVAMLLLLATEPEHGLIWGDASVAFVDGSPRLQTQFGVALWVNVVYLSSMFLLGSLLLVRSRRSAVQSRSGATMVGLAVPWLFGLLAAIDVGPIALLGILPVALMLSAIVVGRALYLRRRPDIAPAVRYAVIEALADAVVVFDAQNCVIDLNPTAERVLGNSHDQAFGLPLAEVLRVYPELVAEMQQIVAGHAHDCEAEIRVGKADEPRVFNMRVTKFSVPAAPNGTGETAARMLILREVTRQKEVAAAERKQRRLAEGQAVMMARRERHLTILNELSQIAIASLDLEELLQKLADKFVDVIDADAAYITHWDETQQRPVPVVASGGLTETYKHLDIDARDLSLTEAVLERGDVVIVENASTSEYIASAVVDKLPGRSLIGLPLVAEGRYLGAVIVAFVTEHKFTLDETAFCRQAAAHIALAVARALHLRSEQQARREAETLRQAIFTLAMSLELDDVLAALLTYLGKLVPYESALVMLLEPENKLVIRATRGFVGDEKTRVSVGTEVAIGDYPHLELLIVTREGLLMQDTHSHTEWKRMPGAGRVRSWLGVPLMTSGSVIGVYSAHASQPNVFDEQHLRLAEVLAAQAAFAVQNAQLFDQVQHLARTDSLTGINNRRHFFELAEREFERARRYHRPLSVLMLDLDHFKEINDLHGHLVGDEILREVAALCLQNLRDADILGRYGGEEFAMLLPEAELDEARNAAERIRRRIGGAPILTRGVSVTVTVSIGVVVLQEGVADVLALIEAADAALYAAKDTGRDRVITT